MIEAYLKHEAERKALGIPARPLDPEQTSEVVKLLENPPKGREALLLALLRDRVSPGVDPAAEVKAGFLAAVAEGTKRSPLVTRSDAVRLLGTMMGGYNVPPLVEALSDATLADDAAKALSGMTYVYDALDQVVGLAKTNAAAKRVVESWAKAEWFTNRPGVPALVREPSIEHDVTVDEPPHLIGDRLVREELVPAGHDLLGEARCGPSNDDLTLPVREDDLGAHGAPPFR